VRWIGWIVVVVVLAAMTFARMTDDKERRGREPDTRPIVSESSDSAAFPADGGQANVRRAWAAAESL
jgi:hypothetical protein